MFRGWITNLEDLHPVGADLEYRGDGMCIRKSEGSSLSDALAISESRPEGKYVFESDVTFDDGNVANLIFGAQSYETTENSFVFKLDRNNRNETKIFYFSGAQGYPLIAGSNGKEFPMGRDSYHMKVVVDGNQCTGYVDGTAVCTGRLPDYYMEGYLGLGAAEGSAAHFQNTQVSELDTSGWITDLTDVTAVGCYLEYDENGIRMNAEGESYLISGVNMGADESFIYETDVRFVEGDCVGLLFGASGAVSKDDAYVFYMNRTGGGGNWWNRDTRLWKFNTGSGDTFLSNDYAGSLTSTDLFETNQEMYHLKLVVDGGACWAYIDGRLAHHYTLPQYAGGYLGIRMDGTAYFQNTKVTRIDSYDVAEITDIQVEDMILTPGFNENDTECSVLAVPYEKESVQITVTASGENAVLYIDGREAESGEPAEVPLEVGKQVIPIRLEDRAAGTESSASVSIYRKQSAASYKTEAWRDQYHFSPLEGWMNDPNGLIYYNDQWHLFYQYIPLTRAHSDYEKHWGHACLRFIPEWRRKQQIRRWNGSWMIRIRLSR